MKRTVKKEKNKDTLIGYITKEQCKTVTIEVRKKIQHKKYGKTLNMSFKYMAHDKNDECCIGDFVLIQQSKSYSRNKHWIVEKIIKKNYIV